MAVLTSSSRVFLKLENLQPGGSFKSRGIGNYMARALAATTGSAHDHVHFYSSSGGNAGIACVHAAVFLGRPSTVVVPLSTATLMIDKIRAAGASDVIQQGATWFEADTYLREKLIPAAHLRGEHTVYVPPFDHPDIWTGHATMMDEIAGQLCEEGESPPAVIACSVGGGGLLNGVLRGTEAQPSWADTVIVAVETKGADSLGLSLQQGQLATLPHITSLATTLGAKTVCNDTFELALAGKASGRLCYAVLSDPEAAMGVWKLADLERQLVELSCGVTIALCFGDRLRMALSRSLRPDEILVLVVCGGHYVTTDLIETWKAKFGEHESVRV